MKRQHTLGILSLTCAALLSACGGGAPAPTPTSDPTPDPGTGGTALTISGKLTVPSGQTANGAQVLACYQGDCANAKSKQVAASASGTYSLTGLEKVQYGIFAFKDLNSDKNIDAQDLQGRSDALVTPPAQNVNIDLTLQGGGGGGETGGTIAGKVTAPKGKNAGGTLIVLCTDKCIVQVEIDASNSATASYVTDKLPAEAYQVIAWKDIDESGEVDEGDYLGFYSEGGDKPTPVTPPATGIDMQMEVVPASSNSAGALMLRRALPDVLPRTR